ncbi:MAG TPA: PaaI family thioesterase [Ilumatobacteraceae bacterium]|nr:PaaI family thioesterase [Ilumatobacteraceae bacterium]
MPSATADDTRPTDSLPTTSAINEMIEQLFPGSNNTCDAIGTDFAIARREISDAELRPGAFVSGPSQFGLADAALWYLVFGATGRIEPMALTSELSIRFLRPAQGKVLWAKATLEVAGRRNVVGTIQVWCDDRSDKPTATAQGTYALPL